MARPQARKSLLRRHPRNVRGSFANSRRPTAACCPDIEGNRATHGIVRVRDGREGIRRGACAAAAYPPESADRWSRLAAGSTTRKFRISARRSAIRQVQPICKRPIQVATVQIVRALATIRPGSDPNPRVDTALLRVDPQLQKRLEGRVEVETAWSESTAEAFLWQSEGVVGQGRGVRPGSRKRSAGGAAHGNRGGWQAQSLSSLRMPRVACRIRWTFSTRANRTCPSPCGPNPMPGETATSARSSISFENSRDPAQA